MHALLADEDLLRFYDLGGGDGGAVGAVPLASSFDWLADHEARGSDERRTRLLLDVQGIRCAACVWLLQTVWRRLPGAIDIRLDASLGRATLVYARGAETAARFLQTAARLGYPIAPASRHLQRDTGLLLRLGICAAVAMNAMILAVSLYFGLDGSGADAASGDEVLRPLFGWVLTILGTISVVVGGPVFFRAAFAGLRARVVHMDLPISIGILLAWAGSWHGQLTGGATYFDTVAIFVAFMLGGRFLQQRTLAKSRDQVLADDGAEHLRARRVRSGNIESVPVRSLRTGDALLLAPGDLVPVRVSLDDERGSFSFDWINGESEPRAVAAGAELPAGAFQAGARPVRATVLADYDGSGLGDLLGQVPADREDTRGRVRFWERLNRGYAIGVLTIAAVLGGAWMFVDPARALPVAVSVLVITCPCAMGIATPLAFHLALALLRRRGVFVRTRSLLDKVRTVRKVVFDKTGTVTFGGLVATATRPVDDAQLAVVATMAASSNHPVSQAMLRALPRRPFDSDLRVEEIPGEGVVARQDGVEYRLGGRSFVGVPAAPSAGRECLVTRRGRDGAVVVVAHFGLEEDFRAGAGEEIAELSARGLQVHLMSGDRSDRVAQAAASLGIATANARGDMRPEDKAAAIAALDDHDVMMVGDGLNDAPAFAASWCAGTPAMDRPVLPARADFCFRGARSGAVVALFDVAGLHARVVRTNLSMALLYNSSTIVVCALGAMTPVLCAVLMPLSSLALVMHTAVRFGRARRNA